MGYPLQVRPRSNPARGVYPDLYREAFHYYPWPICQIQSNRLNRSGNLQINPIFKFSNADWLILKLILTLQPFKKRTRSNI